MPLYEYRCTACDRLTEKRQKFSDPEITDCPFCGGKLERTITAPAVQFKGGGWYADGYGSKKPAAAGSSGSGGSEGSGESKGAAGEGKSSETKSSAQESGSSSAATSSPAASSTPASPPASSTAPTSSSAPQKT